MMRVAVRTLCDFAARSGSLDHRYTPSPTAEEGIEGHAKVQARRGSDYQPELALSGECEGLELNGRADGYDPHRQRLEEIKTHRGDLSRLSEAQQALHWAQLRVYGALLCARDGLESIELALIYYDIGRDRETALTEQAGAPELQAHLVALCRAYRDWAGQEASHRDARDAALGRLRFAFDGFRQGQRALAEGVFKAASTGRHLMLQAPTGIGKTLGTLYPVLMALPKKRIDRLFFLTARTTGRQLALDGLGQLLAAQPEAVPLRILELSARDHACEHPDLACHGESCPLARGFFDRLGDARRAAAACDQPLDRQKLRELALAHGICPYYLGQEMARWSDLVVADVNHFFDQHALLHALTRQNDWKTVLLIDEAHNLIDRARGMYSVEIGQQRVLGLKRRAPAALKKPLSALARQWSQLVREQGLSDDTAACRQLTALPRELHGALQGTVTAITEYLAEAPADAELQELLFEAIRYLRLAEDFGDHSLCELSRSGRGRAKLALRNLIPADFLSPRFEASHSCTLFSATLTPAPYHRDLLGLPESTVWQEVESPFAAHQLEARLETGISTRYQHRQASVDPIVQVLQQQYRRQSGNYLAYFSSFAYLQQVYERLQQTAPEIPLWCQQPGMSQDARRAFIDGFAEDGQGIGFAVLGGAFAEGIDLPGRRLIGAFVATLGLPPFDAWHEELRKRLQRRFGRGYDYAYLFPGMQKVVQAAGRVIRTPEDRGTVVLIDDRFGRPEVRSLLPGWWSLEQASKPLRAD
ncbi:ATP-dependent DNA helicase [Marinobacterium aestuariivivens]|uniref:ATP-dependent DNA helicase n=1 Tax=Marinobacterium aestuariivivens TaxID=1698799 RepID=A0ABW2A3B3_9GAMM